MSATSTVVLAVEKSNEVELPAPAWVLGLIAFGILVALLLITLTFNRDR